MLEGVPFNNLENKGMDLSKIRTEENVKRATLEIPGYTVFDSMVYAATFRIPRGKVSTYGRVAKMIGKPKAYRAVAHSLHRNPLFPVVACHRVVKEDGSFGGDEAGAAGRRKNCEEEGVPTAKGKVVMKKELIF